MCLYDQGRDKIRGTRLVSGWQPNYSQWNQAVHESYFSSRTDVKIDIA